MTLSTTDMDELEQWSGTRIVADAYSGSRPRFTGGDINGDGFDDLVFSQFQYNWYDSTGAGVVVFGKAEGLGDSIDPETMPREEARTLVPWGLNTSSFESAAVGDFNGDGFDDLLQSGSSIYDFFLGPGGGHAEVYWGTNTPATGFKSFEFRFGGYTGSEVTSDALGDINGDGFDDWIVSQQKDSWGPNADAAAFVFLGRSDLGQAERDLSDSEFSEDDGFLLRETAASVGDEFFVSGPGDVNGDGYDDIILNNYDNDSLYLVYGKSASFGASFDVSQLDGSNGTVITGTDAYARMQRAGDINNDGYADIILRTGTSGTSPDVYVIYGTSNFGGVSFDISSIDGTNGFALTDANAGEDFGYYFEGGGDFNGDGIDDLLIADPAQTDPGAEGGAAYVLFGKSAGFGSSVELSTLSNDEGVRFVNDTIDTSWPSAGVGFAGDTNADGYDDILVRKNDDELLLIYGGASEGSGSDDIFRGRSSNDQINLGAGNDQAWGGNGDDILVLGSGNDVAFGNDGDDLIAGQSGNDTIEAGQGADTVNAGNGDDFVRAGRGDDLVRGQAGNDDLRGEGGNDELIGGGGDDTLRGWVGDDLLRGVQNSDSLYGDAGADQLIGGNQGDSLFGGADNDILWGQQGRDRLDGGEGDDNLAGGDNADTFVFGLNYGIDRVSDFTDNTDEIELDDALWGGASLSVADIVATYGRMSGTTGILDFGVDELRLANLGALSDLENDIVIV